MYCVPKIKKFNTLTKQSQKSWRSDLSSESKRHIFLQDISQNLLLLKEDLVNYFQNNKDYLFPTSNEEYICIDSSSSMISPEELLYKLIDIIKSNDFIFKLEEASSTIILLSKQLDDAKSELNNFVKKGNEGTISSYRSDFQGTVSKEYINKLKEKNRLSQRIIKDYDNLVDDYIRELTQKSANEVKIRKLEENLKDFERTKITNEELSIYNKQLKDEKSLNENEIAELKKRNNKLYEEKMKLDGEEQRLNRIIEFQNKEYQDLMEKNNQLMKENYIINMTLQKKEEKIKLIIENINQVKDKNKAITDNLEKKINDKDEQIKLLQNKLKDNIKNLIQENKNGYIEFVLDEFNDKLKILHKGELICSVEKFKREIPNSNLIGKKYSFNSNIHPTLTEIKKRNIKNNKKKIMSDNHKVYEIDNFNMTYKLSQNEYEYDHSSSGNNKISSNSEENSSGICLDKLCQDMSNGVESNQKSCQNSNSKSIKKTNLKNYVDNFFKNYYETNHKKLRRSMTDFKGRKNLNKKYSKLKSFGIDIESIKEEKDEDKISICSFDYKINSKKNNNNGKNQKSKEFTPISSFLETDSFAPVKKKCENFIINRVDDFLIKRKYFYPNNVKLNIKKINIKRVIPMNVKNTQITNENDDSEKCNIF
jgi:hypothetical protein